MDITNGTCFDYFFAQLIFSFNHIICLCLRVLQVLCWFGDDLQDLQIFSGGFWPLLLHSLGYQTDFYSPVQMGCFIEWVNCFILLNRSNRSVSINRTNCHFLLSRVKQVSFFTLFKRANLLEWLKRANFIRLAYLMSGPALYNGLVLLVLAFFTRWNWFVDWFIDIVCFFVPTLILSFFDRVKWVNFIEWEIALFY
jgi:hypothetical protein